MPAPSRFDHVSVTKSNSTRSIATHPCKGRKDGAPPVGMVHAKIVNGGPPARARGVSGGNILLSPFLRAAVVAIYTLNDCHPERGVS
jgi:hypothetical protein